MSDYSSNYMMIMHDFPEIITDVYYDNDLMAIVAKMIDDYLRGYLDWGTPEADIEAAVVDSWAERLIKIHPALETIQL